MDRLGLDRVGVNDPDGRHVEDYLRGTVRHTYRLTGKRLILLEEDYVGGAEAGDLVELRLPGDRPLKVVLDGVAWGSAMASNPPLTLIVAWEDLPDPPPGSPVRGLPPEPSMSPGRNAPRG
jgi:hypothetical protein